MNRNIIFSGLFVLVIFSCTSSGQNRGSEEEFAFITHMIPHHQEAVASAEILLKLEPEAKVHQLLEGIVADQTREISLMQSWLKQWYPGKKTTTVYQPMMRPLSGLAVEEAVVRFLQDMIGHHEMAVASAHTLLEQKQSSRQEVNELAKQIIASQEKEIALMRSWLGDQAPAPLVKPMDHTKH